MTTQAYPEDPHACLRAAERDIESWLGVISGDGLTDADRDTAMHYLIIAARQRRLARERIQIGDAQVLPTQS